MRFVIYGAGAVGGVIAGRLAQHGREVSVIARGAHLSAIRERGLRLKTPTDDITLEVAAAGSPAEVDWRPGDVVLLCVKSQHTVGTLEALREAAGDQVPVVCVQNGVVNERLALRRFANVYGTAVFLPATHLEPGVVIADSKFKTGVLDTGRYPTGNDSIAQDICAALDGSEFSAVARDDIMPWKYTKLLSNLNNAIEAICGSGTRVADITEATRDEAIACYQAAGIAWTDPDVYAERRKGLIHVDPVNQAGRAGNSSWQSMARGNRDIEADYLNGEIVLLGRLHSVPTPANAVLQRLANQGACQGLAPGWMSGDDLLAAIRAERPATA